MMHNQQQSYFSFKANSPELAYPITGAVTGATLSATIGNIGLVGSFGGVAISAVPMMTTGSIVGCAAYGAKEAIENSDINALFPIATGAVIGAGVSSMIGGMGLTATGTAIGIGSTTLSLAGGIAGLGVYGAFKLLDKMGNGETAIEAFNRIEEQIIDADFYFEALIEVMEMINPDKALENEFRELEIEEELKQLKADIKNRPQLQKFQCEIEIQGWYDWHPHLPINPQEIQKEIIKSINIQLADSNINLLTWNAQNIWVKLSDQNYLGNQYRLPDLSKIVDFKLTISLIVSDYDIKLEEIKSIVDKKLMIEEISSLIKLKDFTIID